MSVVDSFAVSIKARVDGRTTHFRSPPTLLESYQKLPLSPLQPDPEERATTRLASRLREELTSSSPLPRFFSHRLTLLCIACVVPVVQQRRANPSGRNYTYKIQASGLRRFEITLPSRLENDTVSQCALLLVRPWHSKLLGSSTEMIYTAPEEQLLVTLGRPLNVLLLIELPYNEYRRIASSIPLLSLNSVTANSPAWVTCSMLKRREKPLLAWMPIADEPVR